MIRRKTKVTAQNENNVNMQVVFNIPDDLLRDILNLSNTNQPNKKE